METAKPPISIPNLSARLLELDQLFQSLEGPPALSKDAEALLINRRTDVEHITAILEYIRAFNAKPNNTLRAVIELKNIVKNHYSFFAENRGGAIDRFLDYLKNSLLEFYLYPSEKGQKWAGIYLDVLKLIAAEDFIAHWPGLLDWLLAATSPEAHLRNQQAFRLLSKITRRYVHSARSDQLYAEIIEVVNKTHEKLLFYAQGYLSLLEASPSSAELYFSTLHFILKVFYHFISQDIHPAIEENIPNWALVLKQILTKNFEGVFRAAAEGQVPRLRELLFLAKGEAIKVVLLVSVKYTEDFQEYVNSFAEDVWQNCQEFSVSSQREKKKVLKNSIKYFKSFCASESYFPFFRANINDILIKLVIPSLAVSEDELAMFEDESEGFVESLFARAPSGNRPKEIVCDFLQILAKFHREAVLEALSNILQELLKGRCLENIINEIVFLDIFINVTVLSYNEQGATQIICSRETVLFVYENLIEGFLLDFISNVKGVEDFGSIKLVLCLVCHFCRFLSFYRHFLDCPKVFGQFAFLFAGTIHIPKRAYAATLVETLSRLINTRSFKMADTLNASVDHLPFYKRFYMNPQKITVTFDRDSFLLNLASNLEAYGLCLEGLVKFWTKAPENITARSVRALKSYIDRTDQGLWPRFHEVLLFILEHAFQSLLQQKLVIDFAVIDNLFESLADFTLKAGAEDKGRLETLLLASLGLLNSNYLELTSLTIQIFAVHVRRFKIRIAEDGQNAFLDLFQRCLEPGHYQPESLGLCAANFQLIQEAFRADPRLIGSSWEAVSKILRRLHEMYQFRVYFEFLNFLAMIAYEHQNLVGLAISGACSFLDKSEKDAGDGRYLFFRQVVIKEFIEFMSIYAERFSFRSFAENAEKSGLLPDLAFLLSNSDFANFLSKVSTQPTRSFSILMLAKVLFSEQDVFARFNLSEQFAALLNCVLENIWTRQFDHKGLAGGFEVRNQERQAFDLITNNSYSSVHRLCVLANEGRAHMEAFVRNLQLGQGPDKFFMEKLAAFVRENGLSVEQIVRSEKYKKLFVGN